MKIQSTNVLVSALVVGAALVATLAFVEYRQENAGTKPGTPAELKASIEAPYPNGTILKKTIKGPFGAHDAQNKAMERMKAKIEEGKENK